MADIPKIEIKDNPMDVDQATLDEFTPEEQNNNAEAWIYTVPWVNDQLTRQIDEPVIDEPIIEEPVVADAPIIEETPVIPEAKIETPKITTPKITADKVLTAEQVKSNQLAIKAQEDANKAAEDEKTRASFNAALKTGNLEDVAKISADNPQLRDSFNALVKLNLKNIAWIDFFKKYNGMSNEDMIASVNNWELVITSDQYKTLSPEQRASFEAYKTEYDATQSWNKDYDKDNFEKQNTANVITTPTYTGFDVRKKSSELMNSPELTTSSGKLADLEWEVNALNDDIDAIEDQLIADWFGKLPSAVFNSLVADKQKALLRKKNTKLNEYNTELGNYTRLKDNVTQELEFLKYEDAQALSVYNSQLKAYEADRKNMTDIAIKEFEANNKIAAADLKFQRDMYIKNFEAENKANDRSWGKYDVDSQWRTIYLLNGESTIVKDAEWEVIFSNEDIEKGFKDTVNFKDWVYHTQRVYDNWDIQYYTSDIKGNRSWPSLNTVDFIKNKEWYRDKAYKDSAWVWTIGYWFTTVDWKPVNKWDTITQIVADAELQKQIWEYTNYEKYITVDLSEEQQTALNSFEYNLGKGIWDTTGKWIIDAINNWDLKTASKIMLAHNKAKDPATWELRELDWLTNRRIEESDMLKTAFDPASKYSKSAQDWARNITRGQANIANVPSDIRTEVSSALSNIDFTLDTDNPVLIELKQKTKMLNDIVTWEWKWDGFFQFDTTEESLVEDISWFFQTNVWDNLTWEKQDLLSDIQFILDDQVLQKLINVKAAWATFWALSDKELWLLTASSSWLNTNSRREDGKLIWFNGSEERVKKELTILAENYKKGLEKKSGEKTLDLDDVYSSLERNTVIPTIDLSSSLNY